MLNKIAARAYVQVPGIGDRLALVMDLTACHNSQPLNLPALLTAPDGSFAHDICGIARHLDRQTGELTDCFLPRYSAQPESA